MQTFTAPTTPSTNSVTIDAIGAGWGIGPTFGGTTPNKVSASADLSITVKGVWTSDANSDNTPPPSVLLSETSTATGTGSGAGSPAPTRAADDGFGDAPNSSGTSTTNGAKYVKASGGTFTAALTLSASGSGTSAFYTSGASASASVGPITISIHAQPYNFRRIPRASVIGKTPDGNPNGEIDWAYAYSSTDGNPADLTTCTCDLTTCTWHEHLTFPSGQVGTQTAPNKYYPPSPPFGYPASGTGWFPNPDFGANVSLVPSPSGSSPEIDDVTFVPAFLKPYIYGTFSCTQVFEFNDSATGEKNVQIPGPDSGPFTIVRTVKYVDSTHYEYDVSKASVPNTLSLPN